jgi:predicted ATP-grasp superfamily ATP-dependent carboligase
MAGVPVLGSSAAAIAVAGDKAACHRLFRLGRLSAPAGVAATFLSAPGSAKQLGFPLVVKPLDGIGSEGVYRVDRDSDLPAALDNVRQATSNDRILLQALAAGIHGSVSLLVSGNDCRPLSLNRQLIETGSSFRYRGSRVPFSCRSAARALRLACSAVTLVPGLQGYVGVDLVLDGERVHIIEINPRLTTSYVGLRQVTPLNLAQAIWNACIDGSLPRHVPISGEVVIKTEDPETWGLAPGSGFYKQRG